MKKKGVLLSIVALLLMSVLTLNVNAEEFFKFGLDLNAKAPNADSLPTESTNLKATITEKFDFSKIEFEPATGTEPIKEQISKIIVGELKPDTTLTLGLNGATSSEAKANEIFRQWFTAYCLDKSMDYPQFGVFSNQAYPDIYGTLTKQQKQDVAKLITRIAFINDENMNKVIKNFESKINGDPYLIPIFLYDASISDGTSSTGRQDVSEAVADSIIAKVKSGENFEIKISAVQFLDVKTGTEAYYTSSDAQLSVIDTGATAQGYLSDDHNASSVTITTNLKKIAFHDYSATKPEGTVKNYNAALWIVEHSYPTLDIETSLSAAGVKYVDLEAEIQRLYSIASTDTEKIKEYTENAVFSTVQMAIWKVTGATFHRDVADDWVQVGDKIKNCEPLNKLFGYLIKTGGEDLTNYANPGVYTNTISVNKPEESKELYKTDTNYYYYGPFTASYNALVNKEREMNIELVDKKDGIDIVDTSYNVINKIGSGKYFYIRASKKINPTSINFKLSLDNVITFKPETNRGRIYYPTNASKGFQNALSGGVIDKVSLEYQDGITINPKTGVENIALLLMITLVAFTFGYLVLSYNSKPIQLNQ